MSNMATNVSNANRWREQYNPLRGLTNASSLPYIHPVTVVNR